MPRATFDTLLNHLRNPEFRDRAALPTSLPSTGKRSRLLYTEMEGGWGALITMIRDLAPMPVTWFPETNVAILPQTEAVWTALRLARLEGQSQIRLGAPVIEELKPWLWEPRHDAKRAMAIREALLDPDGWVQQFGVHPLRDAEDSRVLAWYAWLLGRRRHLAIPGDDGTYPFSGSTSAMKAMGFISSVLGNRAVQLAKKGKDDARKRGKPNTRDEWTCLLAILHALHTGRSTVILTTDYDFVEIFFKAQWFIDTHYKGWLAAKLIQRGEYFSPPVQFIETSYQFFDGEVLLYRSGDPTLHEILPALWEPATAGIICVDQSSGRMIWLMFCFERAMLDMLRTREQTGGRSTDLFGTANIHIDVGPMPDLPRLPDQCRGMHVAVGIDKAIEIRCGDRKMNVSLMDVTHAINCRERRMDLRDA